VEGEDKLVPLISWPVMLGLALDRLAVGEDEFVVAVVVVVVDGAELL
jgi:hypothetical protein